MPRGRRLLIVALLVCLPSLGGAVDRYVATTGDNAVSCTTAQTIGTPKLTMSGATGCISCMVAGDRCLWRVGTYTETINATTTPTWLSGTSGARMTLQNYNNEVVTLQPTGGAQIIGFGAAHGPDFWTIDGTTRAGLILDGRNLGNGTQGTKGIGVDDAATDNIIRNLTVRNVANNGGTGTSAIGISSGGARLTISNVEISGTHDNWGGGPGDFQGSYGVYFGEDDVTITQSYIHDTGAAGLHGNDQDGPLTSDNCSVTRNRIVNIGRRTASGPKMGIVLNNYMQGCLVANNLISGNANGAGIAVYGVSNSNNKVYNNTIVNNGLYGIQIGTTGGTAAAGTILENNLLQGNGSGGMRTYTGTTNTTGLTNVAYSTGAALTHEGTGSLADPLTGNPLLANVAAQDFHLLTGSSAINTCTNTSATNPLDYAGTTHTIPYECGAYNFGTTVTPLVLVFSTPPTTTPEDTIMSPVVQVCAQDSGGVLQTTFANNITLTITTNPGSSTLTGGGATAPVSGCASFSISLNNDANGYKLTAAATGADSVVSPLFNITVVPGATAAPLRQPRVR